MNMQKLREWVSSEVGILGVSVAICLGLLFLMALALLALLVVSVIGFGHRARYIKEHCQPTEQTKTESGVRIQNTIVGKTIISQPIPYTETHRLYICDDGKSVWF